MGRFLWHQWLETIEGDEECGTCHIVVTPDSMDAFTLPCPTPDCASADNPDRGCVITPSRAYAAACIYCGRAGGRARTAEELIGDDVEDDLAQIAAEEPDPDLP